MTTCLFFGFEGRMLDLIVLVPDHRLSFYFGAKSPQPVNIRLSFSGIVNSPVKVCLGSAAT